MISRRWIGESCLSWALGDGMDPGTSNRVLRLYKSLNRLREEGGFEALDVVPSYNSVAVYFDSASADIPRIERVVHEAILETDCDGPDAEAAFSGKEVILPVRYDGADIERVAAHCGFSPGEVICRHAGGNYTVAMIGFLPHFPYLLGLDRSLFTPRLENPRIRVPAGAVGIGGSQTGVYPRESPGGWNIIGSVDPDLLIPIEPGDRVVFRKG